MLPQAAAANARGAAVYIRPGPSAHRHHPGIVLVDDLDRVGLEQLKANGLEPCLIVESSPKNFQAWIRLAPGPVPYAVMGEIARYLANAFNGDPRAISPRQPSRLPGFTNRKPKHVLPTGQFPFVKLTEANPGLVASEGLDLVGRFLRSDLTDAVPEVLTGTGGAGAQGAAPKTPPLAAATSASVRGGPLNDILDAIRREEQERIQRQVTLGRRPMTAASVSEVDFAFAVSALRSGLEADDISTALSVARPENSHDYGARTVAAARRYVSRDRPPDNTGPSW
jgi:hypothetical protein